MGVNTYFCPSAVWARSPKLTKTEIKPSQQTITYRFLLDCPDTVRNQELAHQNRDNHSFCGVQDNIFDLLFWSHRRHNSGSDNSYLRALRVHKKAYRSLLTCIVQKLSILQPILQLTITIDILNLNNYNLHSNLCY